MPRPGEEIDLHGRRLEVREVQGTLVTELALVPERPRSQDRDGEDD